MATLTIKIESKELAREVLAHLGYLPENDSEMPDIVTEEPEKKEIEKDVQIADAFKTWIGAKNRVPVEPKEEMIPQSTRGVWVPDGKFDTTEEPKEGVQPIDNDMGASLEVLSEETDKEREEIRQQCLEVKKSLPGPKERLAAQLDELWGGDRLDYLDALAEHDDDKEMREAVKAYVIKEYTGHDLHLWPALHEILENARMQTEIQEHFNNVSETIRNVDKMLAGLRP